MLRSILLERVSATNRKCGPIEAEARNRRVKTLPADCDLTRLIKLPEYEGAGPTHRCYNCGWRMGLITANYFERRG
jgi:hypothetical protein